MSVFISKRGAEVTFSEHIGEHTVLGCKHYIRGCKFLAPCCQEFFVCRLCHDELQDHKMNRYAVEKMVCMECALLSHDYTVQPVGSTCVVCQKKMARYYCDTCHLFDDDPNHDIYHCHECGLCRRGPRENFFHCKNCNVCRNKVSHRCISNVLQKNCPYCGENLHSSTKPSTFLRQGSGVHIHCLEKFVKYHKIEMEDIEKKVTPFLMAASMGHLNIVKSILMEKEKFKPNPSDDKKKKERNACWRQQIESAFIEAVRESREEVITYLVKKKVSLESLLPLWYKYKHNEIMIKAAQRYSSLYQPSISSLSSERISHPNSPQDNCIGLQCQRRERKENKPNIIKDVHNDSTSIRNRKAITTSCTDSPQDNLVGFKYQSNRKQDEKKKKKKK